MNGRSFISDIKISRVLVLLIVLLLIALVCGVSGQSLDEIKGWKNSLVLCDFNGQMWTTGFFVTEDIVMTPYHLIPTIEELIGKYPIYIVTYKDRKVFPARAVGYGKGADTLFLQIPGKVESWLSEFEKAEWGQECYIIGFPRHWEWIKKGRIITHLTSKALGVNANLYPGGSGSAVLSLDGKILGMAVAIDRNTGNAILVPGTLIQSGLKAVKEALK